MTTTKKRSGRFELSCGHVVKGPLDVEERQKCSTCGAAAIVVRIVK